MRLAPEPKSQKDALGPSGPSSASTTSMIFAVSDLPKSRLRRNSVRSSSLRATIRSRAESHAVDERHGRGIRETRQRRTVRSAIPG